MPDDQSDLPLLVTKSEVWWSKHLGSFVTFVVLVLASILVTVNYGLSHRQSTYSVAKASIVELHDKIIDGVRHSDIALAGAEASREKLSRILDACDDRGRADRMDRNEIARSEVLYNGQAFYVRVSPSLWLDAVHGRSPSSSYGQDPPNSPILTSVGFYRKRGSDSPAVSEVYLAITYSGIVTDVSRSQAPWTMPHWIRDCYNSDLHMQQNSQSDDSQIEFVASVVNNPAWWGIFP